MNVHFCIDRNDGELATFSVCMIIHFVITHPTLNLGIGMH